MRVSLRLARWAVAAGLTMAVAACEAAATGPSQPAAGRPAGASEGLRAAVVVAVTGAATIQPSQGATFVARPDQELLADDTIVVAGDGFVMLELHNGHVVRVRSAEGLRVDRTAAFAEPAVSGQLADRLAAALSPEESRDPRLQVAARVAGWNMRMTSARTFGVQEESKREESKREAEAADVEASPGAGLEAPGPPARPVSPEPESSPADPVLDAKKAPTESPQPDTPTDKNTGRPRPEPPEPKDKTPPPVRKPVDPPPVSDDDAGTESSQTPKQSKAPEPDAILDLPSTVDFTTDGGVKSSVGLPGPLRARSRELALCAGKGVKIRAQVKGRKLVKLEFPGADKCGAGIVGGTVALADGWLELRVKP